MKNQILMILLLVSTISLNMKAQEQIYFMTSDVSINDSYPFNLKSGDLMVFEWSDNLNNNVLIHTKIEGSYNLDTHTLIGDISDKIDDEGDPYIEYNTFDQNKNLFNWVMYTDLMNGETDLIIISQGDQCYRMFGKTFSSDQSYKNLFDR